MRSSPCNPFKAPHDLRGQAALEACIVIAVLSTLACPCVEYGRMALDRMAASQAANALAAQACAVGDVDASAFLANSFPQLGECAQASVNVSPRKATEYVHRLSYGSGRFENRDSTLVYRTIETEVEIARDFVTPPAVLFSSFFGTEGYRVAGKGFAIKDETVESAGW